MEKIRNSLLKKELNLDILCNLPQKPNHKPNGLWYGINNSWLDWIANEQFRVDYYKKCKRYSIEVDSSKILSLNSKQSISDFTKRFSYIPKDLPPATKDIFQGCFINWNDITNEYSGIEFNKYFRSIRMQNIWYSTIDVSSGCIWNKEAIKDYKEIPNPLKSKTFHHTSLQF
jgi:hypothetical protein